MPKDEQPEGLPARLLSDPAMIEACATRNFSEIFDLAKRRGGFYPSLIARRCDMTPSRVGEVLSGQRKIKDMSVVERIADGLRIPGQMLGLASREWEPNGQANPGPASAAPLSSPLAVHPVEFEGLSTNDDLVDPEFVLTLIEGQLPQLYKGANFFGAAQSVPASTHHAQSITRLLETADGVTRQSLLKTGSRVAEFLGWLHQDLGDFRSAAYWSDRAMEWAQEAADDHMQSYVLFRKSHQATARTHPQQAVGLARAAQRIRSLTPSIQALAVQQEAAAYALQNNPKAALTKFDEAHELASSVDYSSESTLDTSYCTPTYIEIQRANCWIDLGQPRRAIHLFEDELKALPPVYRNDRGVYLARLARAYVAANEHEKAAEAADKSLAIVTQTGSARTFAELASVASAIETGKSTTESTAFTEHYETVRRQLMGRDQQRQGR